MNRPGPERVEEILAEHGELRDATDDPELDALRTAIFLEDVFGIVLTDAEIDPAQLGSLEGMRELLARRSEAG